MVSDTQERRPDPMSDDAAEKALWYLRDNAGAAGVAKAQMVQMEAFVKISLNRLKLKSTARSDAAAETEARAHPDYEQACIAYSEAVSVHEELYWKRLAAEATIEAWRSRNANNRGADRMR
jgi:hypothetical protein